MVGKLFHDRNWTDWSRSLLTRQNQSLAGGARNRLLAGFGPLGSGLRSSAYFPTLRRPIKRPAASGISGNRPVLGSTTATAARYSKTFSTVPFSVSLRA